MKKSFFIFLGWLAACQSTKPIRSKKDATHAFNPSAWNESELAWVERATALHEFMIDYYQNPRNFKARAIIGLSEMQKVILRNRSEAWQPHLSERNLRVSWVVDPDKGVGPHRWAFSKDWKTLIQERVLSCRRAWSGPSGITVWILPTEDFKTQLSSDDHEWLKNLGIWATDPDGDFISEDGAVSRKLLADENGAYLETALEDSVRMKSRVAIVINDVDPLFVDSTHRFLDRDLAVLRGNEMLKELESKPGSDPAFRDELKRRLADERTGQHEAIEWLDKNILQASKNSSSAKTYGFPGLWEAYLKGFVEVSNIPGLEYQTDPQFLAHLDQLAELYLGKSGAAIVKGRSPAKIEKESTHRVLSLEYDMGGPVLGLF